MTFNLKVFNLLLLLLITSCSSPKTTEELLTEAQSFINQGDQNSAIIVLKNVIQKEPKNSEARFFLGSAYLEQDKFVSAEKEILKAVQLGYNSPEVYIIIAQFHFQKNDYEQVINTLTAKSFTVKKNKIQALFLLTKAFLNTENFKAAKENIQKIKSIEDDSQYTLLGEALLFTYKNEPENALKLIEQLTQRDNFPSETWLLKGSIESNNKLFSSAAHSYQQYLSLKPQSLNILMLIAHNQIRAREYEQAKPHLELLLSKMPNHPTVNILSAQIALIEQRFDEAKVFSNTALLSTDNALAQLISGISNYYLGNTEQSYYELSAISDSLPITHKAHKILAVLQMKLGYSVELNETLNNLEEINAFDAQLIAEIGSGLLQQGKNDSAEKLFEQAITSQPENANIIAQQGIFKISNNDLSGIESLEKAIQIDPTLEDANIALALSLLQQQKLQEAIKVADDWLIQQPKNINALLLRGKLALKNNQNKPAKEYFESAMQMAPDNVTPLFNLAVLASEAEQYSNSNLLLDKLLNINKEYPLAYRLMIANAMKENKEDELKHKLSSIIKNFPTAMWPRIILSRRLAIEKNYQEANNILEALTNIEELPNAYFETLYRNYSLENNDNAIQKLHYSWQKNQPSNIESYRQHINYLDTIKDYKQALTVSQKGLTNSKLNNNFQLLAFESYYLLLTRQLEQAKSKINRLVKVKPNDPLVLRVLGQIALTENDYSKALKYLERSFNQENNTYTGLYIATTYKLLEEKNKAVSFLEHELEKTPENNTYRRFLSELYIETSPAKALKYFTEFVKKNDDDYIAQNNLAWVLLEKGELEQAYLHALKAKGIKPKNPKILDTLGLILIQQNKFKEAIEVLIQANELTNKDIEILIHLAQAYKGSHNFQKSQEIINQLSDTQKEKWKNELAHL